MSEAHDTVAAPHAWLKGDLQPLRQQLAFADHPSTWQPLISCGAADVVDLASLRQLLELYRCEVLIPLELPALQRAHGHASQYETRELIALDRELAEAAPLQRFAEASRAVGRAQLRRLLSLRDQRLVRRYWRAIERGEAHGWSPVVYGVVLALFSLPLRQGLLHYSQQILGGFFHAGAARLALPRPEIVPVWDELLAALPETVERALLERGPPRQVTG